MPEKSRVTYGRTINLGNYNSERLECSMVIEDGEDPDEKMQACYEEIMSLSLDLDNLLDTAEATYDRNREAFGDPERQRQIIEVAKLVAMTELLYAIDTLANRLDNAIEAAGP